MTRRTNRIVLASGNSGKLIELSELLEPAGVELVPQTQLGVASVEETGLTFVENALLKARHAASATALPAIADDSGLVVDALCGAPGLYSSRYAGPHATDIDNNNKLLQALAQVEDRRAYFYCALVFLHAPTDPAPIIAVGQWHGTIIDTPRGSNGFGYDPHFWVSEFQATAAELDLATKSRSSHRGQAGQRLLELMSKRLVRPTGVP